MKIRVPYAWGFKLYKSSPSWLKTIFDITLRPVPRSLMLGSGFHEKLGFLRESERWSYDKLVEFQEKALRRLMEHAYRNVPYYHSMFKERNLYPSDIRKIGDLRKLPILTKEDIRNNFSELTAVNYKEFKPGLAYTSGSTGKPLEFYLDQQNREWEYASQWRQAFWGGIRDVNAKIATFRGDFVFEYGDTSKVAKWHGLHKELIFNTYLLDPEHVKKMIKILNKFKPEIIKGFPHALYIIARVIEDENLNLDFKATLIQTSSEQLTSYMRETIERAFDTKIFDWYGQSEYVISIGQCEFGTYHQVMETGILDIAADEWGFERLIGTGLWNYSMPFINYEIGDIVKTKGSNGCECGRKLLPIEDLEGRVNDIVVTPSGKAISGGSFDHYWKHRILYKLSYIPQYVHFIQEKVDRIILEFYDDRPMAERDVAIIIRELKLLLGEDVNIEIKKLKTMPKLKKWRFIESKVGKL